MISRVTRLVCVLAVLAAVVGCGAAGQDVGPDAGGSGAPSTTDGSPRPDRSDAMPSTDPPLPGCASFTAPTACDTRDGLDVYCLGVGQSVDVAGRVEYDPGLPLMAMGVGTATAIDGFDLGYITEAYPFRCAPTGCASAIGTGNSDGTDGKICEITFDHMQAMVTTGTAIYRITAEQTAAGGDYLFGFQATADADSTPATRLSSPRFYLRIGSGPVE